MPFEPHNLPSARPEPPAEWKAIGMRLTGRYLHDLAMRAKRSPQGDMAVPFPEPLNNWCVVHEEVVVWQDPEVAVGPWDAEEDEEAEALAKEAVKARAALEARESKTGKGRRRAATGRRAVTRSENMSLPPRNTLTPPARAAVREPKYPLAGENVTLRFALRISTQRTSSTARTPAHAAPAAESTDDGNTRPDTHWYRISASLLLPAHGCVAAATGTRLAEHGHEVLIEGALPAWYGWTWEDLIRYAQESWNAVARPLVRRVWEDVGEVGLAWERERGDGRVWARA